MMPLSLTYDHRVIDGADGARFTAPARRNAGEPAVCCCTRESSPDLEPDGRVQLDAICHADGASRPACHLLTDSNPTDMAEPSTPNWSSSAAARAVTPPPSWPPTSGIKVTLIDATRKPGGTCLHVGCIPSKALLHAAKLDHRRPRRRPHRHQLRPAADRPRRRPRPLGRRSSTRCRADLASCARRARSTIVQRPRPSSSTRTTSGRRPADSIASSTAIIATGSVPAMPPALDLDSPRVMDSTGALKLEDVPKALLVVGGGYIGLEMGYVYAALGSKVTVVEMTRRPAAGRRSRPGRAAAQAARRRLFESDLSQDEGRPSSRRRRDGIKVDARRRGIADASQTFDRVLVAVGRRPNSRGWAWKDRRRRSTSKGFVRSTSSGARTSRHIFAIGDVAGEPMLAHKATYEGKVAVEVCWASRRSTTPAAIPAVVFTDPGDRLVRPDRDRGEEAGARSEVAEVPLGRVGPGRRRWAAPRG